MDHLRTRFELAERLTGVIEGREPLPKRLRPYQQETLASFVKWLREATHQKRAHIAHATGLGKTVLYATLARQAVGLRMLFIMPTKTLVAQTARVLAPYAGGIVGHLTTLPDITVSKTDSTVVAVYGHDHHSIVLTTDQGFRSHRNDLIREFRPHLILRDECHWAYTDSTQWALKQFEESIILGVTATPDYLGTVARYGFHETQLPTGQLLYSDPQRCASTHFGPCLDSRSAAWGMANKYLCPLEWRRLGLELDLASVPIKNSPIGYDYEMKSLNKLMDISWTKVMSSVLETYEDTSLGLERRRAISLCATVNQATRLAEALSAEGIPTREVNGETPDEKRDEIFQAFEAGEIKHVCSVQVLREGWDSPNADTAFMLRPFRSLVAYVQGVGRILRLPEDRPDKIALAIDLYGGNDRCAPLSAPIVFGTGGDAGPLEVEYWASNEGRLEAEGVTYVSPDYLVSLYGYAWTSLTKDVRRKQGRMPHEGVQTFYASEDVRAKLARTSVSEPTEAS